MKALSLCCCLCCVFGLPHKAGAQDAAEIIDQNAENALFWFGLLLLGCFLLAGKHAYTQIWQKRSLSATDAQQLRETRQRLLRQVAELDERYEVGRLDEHVYMRERAWRKHQLVELTILYKDS